MKINNSILLNTDSYKSSMFLQYPPHTEFVHSYIESRGGRFDKTVFFGLQAFLKDYLSTPITKTDVAIAKEIWEAHGEPFNEAGWNYIVDTYHGYLPVRIKAVAEGSVVPTKNALVTIENLDPHCFWLTTWIETALLRAVWYPTTVATQSHAIRKMIKRHLEETGDVSGLAFKLHDFGARGVSSFESAVLGGMAHLATGAMGTDTMSGILGALVYYDEPMAGYSIPAAEHSTITSWGRFGERNAYHNMLKQFAKPGAMVAIVSDSYDVFRACQDLWGGELKQEIIDSEAVVIIRPDSGDPLEVNAKLIQILDKAFGHTINDKGYKVLNHVRLIQGDGVNYEVIDNILTNFKLKGYSADNIAFGMGGGLLQQLDRDTQKFAMKCSAAKIDGKWVDVQKDPITDHGKKSKKGRQMLQHNKYTNEWRTISESTEITCEGGWEDALETLYQFGAIVKTTTFSEIRANVAKDLD